MQYKEGIVYSGQTIHLCRVFISRLIIFCVAVSGGARLQAAAEPPPVPAPNLDIPRIIQEERRRLEAARAAANKPPQPEPIGPPFPAEVIEENRNLLNTWIMTAQTAEKEGRIKDAVDMYIFAFKKMQDDEVMPFMPAAEIKPLAEGLTRIQLQRARSVLQDQRDNGRFDEALIALAELGAWMPEAESTRLYLAQAADLGRQVERMKADFKRRSPSRDALTRLAEIRGNQAEIERLLRDGMILFDAKDYDNAYKYFERVIYLDPLEGRAEHYLKQIHNVRIKITDKRRQQQFRERVHKVNEIWIDDDRRHDLPVPNPFYRGPKGLNIQSSPIGGGGGPMGGLMPKFQSSVQQNLGAARIHQKLQSIQVPEIRALNGLTLDEVVTLLDQAVRDADPEKRGINFRINTTIPEKARQAQRPVGLPLAGGPRPRVDAFGLPLLPDVPSEGSASAGQPSGAKPAVPVAPVAPQPKPVQPAPSLADGVTFDPRNVQIRGLTTPLRGLNVGELIAAISESFNVPIHHQVSSFGVTFAYRGPEEEKMFTRKFQINASAVMSGFGLPDHKARLDELKNEGVKLTPVRAHNLPQQVSLNGNVGRPAASGDGSYYKQTGNDLQFGIAPGPGGGAPGPGGPGPGGGAPGGGPGGGGNALLANTAASQAIENLFRQTYGLNVRVFFNDRRGIMLVRGPLSDLEMVEQILDVFNATAPLVKMKAKFAEIEYDDNDALGFEWYLGNLGIGGEKLIVAPGTAPTYIGQPTANNPSGFFPFPGILQGNQFVPSPNSIPPKSTDNHLTSNFKQHGNPMLTLTGILTDPQFRMVLNAMSDKEGVDVLSSPEIITVSGRPAQLNVQDQRYIVTGVTPAFTPGQFGGGGAGAMMPNISSGNFGPQFAAVPYVGSDMFTIEMQVQPTFTEFLGYEDTSFEATAFAGGNVVTQPIALPRFRTRTVNVDCVVWDGYTISIGGMISETVISHKDSLPFLGDMPFIGGLFRGESTQRKKKNMNIYVTSTIVDPAGNPVNTEETLPFMRQPEGEVPNHLGLQP